jgi:hypothetical protein
MSTLTDKLVDFDIMVESEPRREAPAKPGLISEHTSALEESVFRLNGMLMNIKRIQKQCVDFLASALIRTRLGMNGLADVYPFSSHHTQENRGFSIVKSTQKYANSFSLSFL